MASVGCRRDEGVLRCRPHALAGSFEPNDGGNTAPGRAHEEEQELADTGQGAQPNGNLLVPLHPVGNQTRRDPEQREGEAIVEAVDEPVLEGAWWEVQDDTSAAHC